MLIVRLQTIRRGFDNVSVCKIVLSTDSVEFRGIVEMLIRSKRFHYLYLGTEFFLSDPVNGLFSRFSLLHTAPWNKPVSHGRFILPLPEDEPSVNKNEKINRYYGSIFDDSTPIIRWNPVVRHCLIILPIGNRTIGNQIN